MAARGAKPSSGRVVPPDPARMKRYFTEFEQLTQEARQHSLTALDYYDSDQFTRAEKGALEERGRPAIAVNRVKPAVSILRS